MIDWNYILKWKKNRVINFRVDNLLEANFVYPGSTNKMSLESKRYEKWKDYSKYVLSYYAFYESILMSDYFDIDPTTVTCSGNRTRTGEYTENVSSRKLYETVDKNRKLEECGLSYLKINYDSLQIEIESEVKKFFGTVEQVTRIYSMQYDDFTLHFQILTNNTKCDRSLMMKLLDIEYEINHKYKHIDLSFDYIPRVYDSESEVVMEEAKLIYKKDILDSQYELITSSPTASSPQQTTSKTIIPLPATV